MKISYNMFMGNEFWKQYVADVEIDRVLVICKSHLDLGFTDFAANVRAKYIEQYIPQVIQTARRLREEDTGENLVWTSGSYIIYEYWRQAREECEAALAEGILAYHALPFTTHSEFYDASLYAALLQDCRELDAVCGRHTRAAKMTDVPGHSCGIVPILAKGGVEFLHLGINPASFAPQLPPCFRWRVGDAELVVMYSDRDYAKDVTLPDRRTRVVFFHAGDNGMPPDVIWVRVLFRMLRIKYPNARIAMGSLDDLADAVMPFRESLPVVETEVGDSWIHGVATDCVKSARFRELLRFRTAQAPWTLPREFDRKLSLVGEHTWGLDVKSQLGDDVHWSRPEFDRMRKNGSNYARMEASWREQRAYLDDALATLPEELRHEAKARLAKLTPRHWDFSEADCAPPVATTKRFRASFDTAGNLAKLEDPAGELDYHVAPGGLLKILYHAYGAQDVMRYLREYCPWDGTVEQVSWGAWDMGKVGVPEDVATGAFAPGKACFAVDDEDAGRLIVRVRLAWPDALVTGTGAPATLEVEYAFDRAEPRLEITAQWFDKCANRLPEALIAHFGTTFSADADWRMRKLGLSLAPHHAVVGGGTGLHAVDAADSWSVQEASSRLTVSSPDVPLLMPDDRGLWTYRPEPARPSGRFAFCLSNNQWGTNFPQWCDDDFRCRFLLSWN